MGIVLSSKKIISFLFVSISVSNTVLLSQAIDSMLQSYSDKYIQQKVYVQFDKTKYASGETIWFKAYLFEGNQPAIKSKNFYAELIDAEGNIIQRKVYPIVASSVSGNFEVPATLTNGFLFCRGYTTWMLNFDTTFFFQRFIPVGNNSSVTGSIHSKEADVTSFELFPEGGSLVAGLQSKVAFKASDKNGFPVPVNGKVIDQNGTLITTFRDQHDGLGFFNFTPFPNFTYRAILVRKDRTEYSVPLPPAKPEGMVVQITDEPGKKIYTLNRTENVPPAWKKLNVIALINQQVFYKAIVPMKNLVNKSFIPIDECPSGVLQISIFSEDWQLLAERLTMVKNENSFVKLNVQPVSIDFNKRAENNIELSLNNADSAYNNLSVSITDATNDIPIEENIISQLLLTSDMKGWIYNPSYYFSNDLAETKNHLDLVMLTHEFRKLDWENLKENSNKELKFPSDHFIKLEARLTTKGKIKDDEAIECIIQKNNSNQQIIALDKVRDTIFSSQELIFYDTAQLFYSFKKDKSLQKHPIFFDNGFYKGGYKISKSHVPPTAYDSLAMPKPPASNSMVKSEIEYYNKNEVLENVTVKTKAKTPIEKLDEKYAKGFFSDGDAFKFDVENDKRALGKSDVFSYLQNQVPGLEIGRSDQSLAPVLHWRGHQTALFLDELPVTANTLSDIDIENIAYIKVFRPIFMSPFGYMDEEMGSGAGGAIVVYTKKENKVAHSDTYSQSTIVGYASNKPFFSPDYSNTPVSSEIFSDNRATLLWAPFVTLNPTDKPTRLIFYNNDAAKAYKIVVEGITVDGKIIHYESLIRK